MLKRTLQSTWFPFVLAALCMILPIALRDERSWLLGLAGTAIFWGIVDLVSGVFGEEEQAEGRFDTAGRPDTDDP